MNQQLYCLGIDENQQHAEIKKTISEFFDVESPENYIFNLRSVLYQALTTEESFSDPQYRSRMVFSFDRIADFIRELASQSGKSPEL